mmetsp:Transcript_18648/g.27894  ORF Transcript_18648/g.27894 Transcript_18648/m.27894 type:complete len:391 (+) Transcript_18648:109-1281(+)
MSTSVDWIIADAMKAAVALLQFSLALLQALSPADGPSASLKRKFHYGIISESFFAFLLYLDAHNQLGFGWQYHVVFGDLLVLHVIYLGIILAYGFTSIFYITLRRERVVPSSIRNLFIAVAFLFTCLDILGSVPVLVTNRLWWRSFRSAGVAFVSLVVGGGVSLILVLLRRNIHARIEERRDTERNSIGTTTYPKSPARTSHGFTPRQNREGGTPRSAHVSPRPARSKKKRHSSSHNVAISDSPKVSRSKSPRRSSQRSPRPQNSVAKDEKSNDEISEAKTTNTEIAPPRNSSIVTVEIEQKASPGERAKSKINRVLTILIPICVIAFSVSVLSAIVLANGGESYSESFERANADYSFAEDAYLWVGTLFIAFYQYYAWVDVRPCGESLV